MLSDDLQYYFLSDVAHALPGTILGLTHAGTSVVSTIAPIIGAQFLTHLGFPSLGIAGTVINAVLLMVLTRY